MNPNDIVTLNDYSQIPHITKQQIIENQRESPPFGDLLATEVQKLSRIYVHPGPEYFGKTKKDLETLVDSNARAFYTCGVRKEDIVDVTINYNWVLAGTGFDEGFRKIGCAVIPGGVGMTKTHIQAMKETKTTVVIAFPTFFEQIAETAAELGVNLRRDLSLRLGMIVGELRSDESKTHLMESFGIDVREAYGGAEVGGCLIAAECEVGEGWHIFGEYAWEVIDPRTEATLDLTQRGELVITGLVGEAMPLLRYRTGDLVDGFNTKPCPCGRTTPRMKRVLGRVTDIPRVKGMFVVPKQVEEALDKFSELAGFQLIIDRPEIRDILTLKVEYKGNLDSIDAKNLASMLAKEMKETVRLKTEVELVKEGTFPDGVDVVKDLRKI
jgi:phenylacetate-CoA ligase